MGTIILNVIIILGIIIAGGFLIFFVGDLLLSIIDPKSDERKIKNKRKKDVDKMNERLEKMDPEIADEVRKDPGVQAVMTKAEQDRQEENQKQELENGGIVEAFHFDSNELVEEKKEEEKKEEKTVFNDEDSEEFESDESEDERRLREARESLERRKAEILRRLQEDLDDESENEEENTEESSEQTSNDEADLQKESSEDEVEEDEQRANLAKLFSDEEDEAEEKEDLVTFVDDEESEETEENKKDALEDERRALEEEKIKYQELIKELQEKQEIIKVAPVTASAVVAEAKLLSGKDEYIAKLKEKEDALAANEKELKACKKEYMPLYKVKKTLEKDEKKLRIKEAQVAKQKVVLYGVNNYGDIDEEKAKRLAEELDLLDGLKLSVQHCKEVMEENKDRLPILEKMYRFLEKQNAELKSDVEYLKKIVNNTEE